MTEANDSPHTRVGSAPLRILHVGRAALHARLLACLQACDDPVQLEHATDLPAEHPGADVLVLDETMAGVEPAAMAGLAAQLPIVLLRPDPPGAEAIRAAVARGAEDVVCLDPAVSGDLVSRFLTARARHEAHRALRARAARARDDEARFRGMVQSNADGVMIVSADGMIQYANPAAESLFQRSVGELVGQSFGSPLVSDTTTELDLIRPAGESTVVELRAVEIPWDAATAWLVSLRDITDRRAAQDRSIELVRAQAAQRQAEAAEAEARLTADASDALDASLDLGEALQAFTRCLVPRLADWCTLDLLLEEEYPHRFVAADAAIRETRLRETAPVSLAGDADPPPPAATVLRTGEPQLLTRLPDAVLEEVSLNPADARALRTASMILVPVPTRQGPAGVLTLVRTGSSRFTHPDLRVATDVARRAGNAVERVRLFREAQAANKAKSDFLAVMSHELRTPLNSIMGYVDILLAGIAGELTADQGTKLGRIRLSARHLLQLIEEILSYARMEAGREQVRPERTTLRDLLDEVAALTEPLARERGLAFRVQHADGTELVTDVPKVRQILLNLLTNAVKFTEEGEVELGFEEDQDHVRLLVRDTGPGIDPENQERIFDPFWQVAHPQTRRTGGTGLGLSVARRLARLMGGDLDVRSAPGQGSTFIVELPRKVGLPPPPNG